LSRPISREKIKQIGNSEGEIQEIRPVLPAEIRYQIDTSSLESLPDELERVIGIKTSRKYKYCFGLENVKIWGSGRNNIVLYDRNHPVFESTHGSETIAKMNIRKIVSNQGLIKSLVFILEPPLISDQYVGNEYEKIFDFTYDPSGFYYGWLTTMLPKLEAYEESELTDSSKILVSDSLTKWARDSLEFLGYNKEELETMNNVNIKIRKLFLSSSTSQSNVESIGFDPDSGDRRWLREQALSKINRTQTNGDGPYQSKMYISRSDASTRKVVNEDELLEMIEPLGFESYTLSEMNFDEQIKLFSQADIILGPHGAGFSNMVFAEDATVMELFKSNDVRPPFFVTSCELGFDYNFALCEPVGDNMRCDVEKITKLLDELID
jgi:hypothetical protein